MILFFRLKHQGAETKGLATLEDETFFSLDIRSRQVSGNEHWAAFLKLMPYRVSRPDFAPMIFITEKQTRTAGVSARIRPGFQS
jgi:hypothetical protein